ncbi:MAG: hypothetical protein AMQ22_00990 [Candidatus Methanofastidiosum methylothiophilum]|uniref:Uncharacterized protein n=1 Tax=Candidatus Methanofastidiosum methylothiophilum TaxID=1705564 RepID=A0A150J4D5_9EURY|nr:MAG: hypothetical protein AMQ22_00990 [Candidatus Methanofastidiosum methylthiophilus]
MTFKETKIMNKKIYLLIIMLLLAIFSAGCTKNTELSDLQNTGSINNQVNESQQNKDNMTPPNEAIEACKGKSIGQECQFESKDGNLSGVCDDRSGVFGCAPYKPEDFNKTPEKSAAQTTPSQICSSNYHYNSCINNTRNLFECKDCCDCIPDADGNLRTKCRDECAVHDFSKNSEFIPVNAPSTLGPDGNYSQCVAKGSSSGCKACCENFMGLECGDYRFCRTACNNTFGNAKPQPPPEDQNNPEPPPKQN